MHRELKQDGRVRAGERVEERGGSESKSQNVAGCASGYRYWHAQPGLAELESALHVACSDQARMHIFINIFASTSCSALMCTSATFQASKHTLPWLR